MFFGLCLTSNTTFQKILALLGPPRSGKGTTCRTLSALLGAESVASLALGDLAREFGLEKLIGMPVAIMPDVRFGNRDNVSDAIERMLSISGEDEIRIARKYQPDWSGKLPTRIIMASNEMPRLPDAAAALPTRLLVLQFVESHVGKEDLDLANKLQNELPGILAWSVEGYSKLLENKGFPENDSTIESVEEAKEIASPMHAFLADCFAFQEGATAEIQITEVYELYKRWCTNTGRTPACVQIMSKQIKDLNPKLRTVRPGGKNNDRKRCFSGMNYSTFGHQLKLKIEAERRSF
jgi:putative DNA primase/helicase